MRAPPLMTPGDLLRLVLSAKSLTQSRSMGGRRQYGQPFFGSKSSLCFAQRTTLLATVGFEIIDEFLDIAARDCASLECPERLWALVAFNDPLAENQEVREDLATHGGRKRRGSTVLHGSFPARIAAANWWSPARSALAA